jgi:hypothetical protein
VAARLPSRVPTTSTTIFRSRIEIVNIFMEPRGAIAACAAFSIQT